MRSTIHRKTGRGAVSNPEGRFEKHRIEPFDDGWGSLELEETPPLETTVTTDSNRTILTENKSPDLPFELSINPYRGCEHGCIYCYARPSHSFLGLSPGLDFETRLYRKTHAADQLEKALRKPKYRVRPITLGANTDAYQPVEREHRITRELLEVLHAYRHPVAIITKGALVLRDLDLLSEMGQQGLARVIVSATTLDPQLARIMEPRAAAPHRRIEMIAALHEAGVPVSVNAAPMIPAINDMELERIIEAGAKAGADSAGYILVRLPNELAELFTEWLETHFPDRASHVLSLLGQMRDGRLNDPRFGFRMRGSGPYAELLSKRCRLSCRRLGLNQQRPKLRTDLFRLPPRVGDQLSLFED